MSTYFYSDVPNYYMNKFRVVRSSYDNLFNTLQVAEIINSCPHCLVDNDEKNFDIAVITGESRRALIKKKDGHFSMSIPFQVVIDDDGIFLNFDDIKEKVSGIFISIVRNIIQTIQELTPSHEEIILSLCDNIGISLQDAIKYFDAFSLLIAKDHGYFRFDDDPNNQNGDIHPRYHFDIFFRDSSSLKIGYHDKARLNCFYSLFDTSLPKKYLVDKTK